MHHLASVMAEAGLSHPFLPMAHSFSLSYLLVKTQPAFCFLKKKCLQNSAGSLQEVNGLLAPVFFFFLSLITIIITIVTIMELVA